MNETNKTWYKLDLSANVYPTLQRQQFSSVFRLSALMTVPVNPGLLQKAVNQTLPRFPIFTTCMKKGLFWRYLEANHRPGPFVMPDISNPCMPMRFKANNHYLIRFYYYKNRISLEVFHSLADGAGAMYLLKTVLAVYLRLLGHEVSNSDGVLDINEKPDPEEWEDAYMRYATAAKKAPRMQGKAFPMNGTQEPFYTLNIICGIIPVDILLKKAKSYKVSLTEYLNAVLLHALLEYQKEKGHHKKMPVKLAMPVNLRQFYPSKTLRNFITMVFPSIDPSYGAYTFEELLHYVHHDMRYRITPKLLQADITTNAAAQKNFLIRPVPLFIKDFTVKSFYNRVQKKQSTVGLTNVGIVKVPVEMEPHIERFDVLMGQPYTPRTNCAIVSYKNNLTINFASSIVEADVEKYFFRKLIQEGVPVKIESNRS